MAKQNKSIERIVSQYKGFDISDISLVQSLHSEGNYEQMAVVLNKTYLPRNTVEERRKFENYMKGLGRLANQYISLLSQPTNRNIQFIRKKYRINLTNDYHRNLIRLGNREERITNEDIQSVDQILAQEGNLQENRRGNLETTITDVDVDDLVDSINIIDRQSNRINNTYHITHYRLFMKLHVNRESSITNEYYIWVSSKKLRIGSRFNIEQFIDRFSYLIEGGDDYNYNETESVVVDRIEEVRIEYY